MTSDDCHVMDLLADADAQWPPPPGTGFTGERLAALATRRLRRRAIAAVSVVLATALVATLWSLQHSVTPAVLPVLPRPVSQNPFLLSAADLRAEWRALCADAERLAALLQADRDQVASQTATSQAAAARRLRKSARCCACCRCSACVSICHPLPNVTRHLVVWFEHHAIGDFRQLDDGRKEFAYRDSWRAAADGFAISLSLPLPLRAEAFGDRETRAFFGGLLPDDEARRRIARHLQVSWHNEFALLAEVGRECAGALALYPPDLSPAPPENSAAPPPLTDHALAKLLRDLPRRPLFAGGELRLSLAGAQDKIAVVVDGDAIALPPIGCPTTHIVKVPIANFEATVANEFFVMQLAGAAGLAVPRTAMRVADGMPILLVERFDRVRDANGVLRRRHQEDFCQALGVPPEPKYQGEGGPALPAMFALLTAHSTRAAVDRLALLQMVLFHFLLGNADAHAKNFSLLLGREGVRLTPVYDAMSTLVYPSLSTRLAMKIGSRYEFDEIAPEHWTKFAATVGLSPPFVRNRLRDLAAELPQLARRVVDDHEALVREPLVDRILTTVAMRCRRALDQLAAR